MKIRSAFNLLTAFALCALFSSLTHAQATRTWVSGVGDDVNPCSRTAPCKTFAGAISKTAAGGEISVLDPGAYGTVTITKALTIDGGTGAGWASILSCGVNGVIINAGVNDVITLRNLSINGCRQTASPGLNGIRFLAGKALHVQNVNVFGFGTHGIDVSLTADQRFVTVLDSTIRECGGSGIRVTTTTGFATAVLSNVQIDRCADAVTGAANSNVTIRNSTLTLSTNGVNTGNNSFTNIDNSLFPNNGTGVNVVAGATARLNNNTFANNLTGVANNGSAQSAANNKFAGNNTDRSGAAFGALGVQ